MRRLALLLIAALTLAACGGAPVADVQTGGEIFGEMSNDATGGLVAPDFSVTLHDGTTWRLSEQDRPVHVVFWADW